MAKAKTEEVKTEGAIDVSSDPHPDWVEIPPLFYDADRYSAPVFVGVNGKTYLIKRGVSGIRVPRAVKKVLEQSEYQNQMAMNYIKSIEGDRMLGEM